MLPKIAERKTKSFTAFYHQPDDYHFCLDSVLLAEFAAEQMPSKLASDYRVLDLCAGCGVVGLELAHLRADLKNVDFVEVQSIFQPYFQKNRDELADERNLRFFSLNYDDLLDAKIRAELDLNHFDLIVANPPYFFSEDGRAPATTVKNRCRFFLDSNFESLIDSVVGCLKPSGSAYILVKDGQKHGRHLVREAALHLAGRALAKPVADIRGTYILHLKKQD